MSLFTVFPTEMKAFLLPSPACLAPGLFTPQNVLTTEMNAKPGFAATKPGAGSLSS